MKKLLLLFVISFFVINLNAQNKIEKYFISPDGNDSWTGKLDAPNSSKTDGPFKTIMRAKEEVRKIKNIISPITIEINFRSGEYLIDKTIFFVEEDGVTDGSKVIYKAYPNETVSFIGAKRITGFKKTTDPSILSRIDKKVQNQIYEIDLKGNGISDYGKLKPQGFGRSPKQALQMELFFNGKPMLLAQYPNKEWLIISGVPQSGDELKNKGEVKAIRFGIPVGRHYGKIKYETDRPSKWKADGDIWMHGYWSWDWADAYDKVKSIDKINKIVTVDTPYSNYGYTQGQRFRFINVLEEIDSPGEYYIDRTSGKLYFYPPSDISKGKAYVTTLSDLMLNFNNCSNVSFQKIIFEYSRYSAVTIKDGNNINLSGCTFRDFGVEPVSIEGGKNNGLTSCDLYDNAAGGVYIEAGDRKTITPAGNYVDNCTFHDFGRIFRTYAPAISLNGVGNRATHNHIYDAPHMGIYYIGNEHLIEYNEIDHIAKETGDVGAIYTGRDYTSRGTIIRYNYLHELHGPGLCGVMGVYLDDFSSGTTIYGNIFYKAGHSIMLGGGRSHTIENNVFVDDDPSIFIDGRGMFRDVDYFDGRYNALWEKVDMYNVNQPPYSVKYPDLVNIRNDDPAVPKYNKIINNVSSSGRFLDLYSGLDFSLITIKNNLIADPIILRRSERSDIETEKFINYDITDKEIVYKYSIGKNVVVSTDPGFENMKEKDFRLKKDSKAFEMGFKEIPVSKIGIYKDEFRK
jgi:hypothetical protein